MLPQNTDSEPLNILVFGPTGVGKSTIINLLTSARLPVGHSLQSCTQQVEVASTRYQGRQINYFDTPGFDDSILTWGEQMAQIGSLSSALYEAAGQTANIHGILYIHRITDNKMTGSTLQNLRVLEKLLGSQALQNLVFVTNMWSNQPDPDHVRFEEELVGGHQYFAAAIGQGARGGEKYRICKGATRAQAQEALSNLFLNSAPVVMQIQRDMVDEKRALRDTNAGRIVNQGVEQFMMGVTEFMNEIRRGLATLPREKEEGKRREYEDAENQYARAEKQGAILQLTLEAIRRHPYLSTLVALVVTGAAGAIVLGAGEMVVVANLKVAGIGKVAALGTPTASALAAPTTTTTVAGAGVGGVGITAKLNAGVFALMTAAGAAFVGGSKQDKKEDVPN
ncbi:unnamed protein product [Rhizoctonia solani]|uniref:G domain-containing protein n=1 Tax=Rhizoctonia solani TaxID=456999 RepID=A0A8H3CRJ5_9AGAM|nr:unnamed protein product [Rhizoctonia solani]